MANDFDKYLLPEPEVAKVILPSGMEVTLRTPGLEYYLSLGSLPGRLSAIAADKPEVEVQEDAGKFTEKSAADGFTISTELVCHVCVSPKFHQGPTDENGYNIERLNTGDISFILGWATKRLRGQFKLGGGGADLANFPKEPGSNDRPVSDGPDVVQESEQLPPASSSGEPVDGVGV